MGEMIHDNVRPEAVEGHSRRFSVMSGSRRRGVSAAAGGERRLNRRSEWRDSPKKKARV